jgi:hypothetical protein
MWPGRKAHVEVLSNYKIVGTADDPAYQTVHRDACLGTLLHLSVSWWLALSPKGSKCCQCSAQHMTAQALQSGGGMSEYRRPCYSTTAYVHHAWVATCAMRSM